MTIIRTGHLLAVTVIMLIWLLASGCTDSGGSRGAQDSGEEGRPSGRPVAAVELTPRDLSRHVEWLAPVQTRHPVRVSTRVAGIVETLHAEEGDEVAAGELLATLDTRESSAELARAAAEEMLARTELGYQETLHASDTVSRHELERARTALAVAVAERELWQARVDLAAIHAPRDGRVSARHVEPGESAEADQLLFELIDPHDLVVRPAVSERDLVHIDVGSSARVRLDALPDAEVEGQVSRLFPAADSDSRLFRVEFRLQEDAGAALGVRPGFLARVQLQLDSRPAVLAVPAAAIGEDENGRFVFVISEGELERRGIEPGVTRGEWTEIRAGLESGEAVLASNPIDMRAGEQVRIVDWRG